MSTNNLKYELKGRMSINTTIQSQSEVLTDLRSIKGVTIVGFTPDDLEFNNPRIVVDNEDYKGDLSLKIDTFPFKKFNKKEVIQNIIDIIKKMPSINYFRPSMVNLMEIGYTYNKK